MLTNGDGSSSDWHKAAAEAKEMDGNPVTITTGERPPRLYCHYSISEANSSTEDAEDAASHATLIALSSIKLFSLS